MSVSQWPSYILCSSLSWLNQLSSLLSTSFNSCIFHSKPANSVCGMNLLTLHASFLQNIFHFQLLWYSLITSIVKHHQHAIYHGEFCLCCFIWIMHSTIWPNIPISLLNCIYIFNSPSTFILSSLFKYWGLWGKSLKLILWHLWAYLAWSSLLWDYLTIHLVFESDSDL